jgi:hypothetical protein
MGQAVDRALQGDASRVPRPRNHASELFVRVAELDMRDDQLAVAGPEARERGAISRHLLVGRGALEWRGLPIRESIEPVHLRATSVEAPMFVANAIAHGGAKIGGQCVAAARLQRRQAAQGAEYCVVNEIGCIRGAARPPGKPAVSPARETRKVAPKQVTKRVGIAHARAVEEL